MLLFYNIESGEQITMETNQPLEKKGNNRILIIVGAILLLCCCVTAAGAAAYITLEPVIQSVNQQLAGYAGIASEQLKSDVLKGIAEYEASQSGCSDVTLINGHLFLSPEQSGDGTWIETWQVMVCGESRLYSISFTPSPLGGTDFSVRPLDQ
jgi:hypothetical protein